MLQKRKKVTVKCRGSHVSTENMRNMGYRYLKVIPKIKSKAGKSKEQ